MLSSPTHGVVHPFGNKPEPLPNVRCPDARSRQTDRPDGVAFSLQVIANKVKPAVPNRCFNLLTKEDWRAALADEAIPRWPKMAGIGAAPRFSRTTEGLTGATTRPNRSVVAPSGEAQGVTPAADAGKEVALGVSGEVGGLDIHDGSCIYVSCGNLPRVNQFAQPLSGFGVVLVVIVHGQETPS